MRCKRILLCLVALLFMLGSFSVFAQELDPNKTGSVSVTLTDPLDKDPIVGAELSVYHVATVAADTDGQLLYTYTDEFRSCSAALDDKELAETLDSFVTEHTITPVVVTTDENGTAVCKDLALGLYFVKQTGTVEGFTPCTPFLVTVPGEDADGYVYDVNASPKTEVTKLVSITIKKVWNTDAATEAADHVTVQLLRKGKEVETATLNAQNNWQITYTDMPASDDYSIKEIDIPKGFTATYSNTGYEFTVTNTSTLIQTGQMVWPIPVLAVSGLLLIAVGIALLQKKRKTHG